MIMQKTRYITSVLAALLLFCPQAFAADNFKSSDFLKWTEGNRNLYIRTSIGMAGLISGYNDESHAKCLESWYFSDEEKSNKEIFEAMLKYSKYHPRGVIIAILKKHCGTFDYALRKK